LRKLLSISLLFVFLFFQTGRILLYLECRFSNSITTTSCDCGQILAGDNSRQADGALPANSSHASHKHLPEEFETPATLHLSVPDLTDGLPPATAIHFNAPGHYSKVFHPPIQHSAL
jgi:hypothetical protein